jgi:hypothetical protein
MKKVQQRKKIIIPFSGYIGILGVIGPVEIPYMETLETIAKLLMRRIPVYEITSDGSKVKLTMSNYRKNNGSKEDAIKKTYEPSNTSKKKVNVITVTDEEIEESSIKNLLKNSTKKLAKSKEYEDNSNNKKKDKKNKWKNHDDDNPVYVGVPGSGVDGDMVETK